MNLAPLEAPPARPAALHYIPRGLLPQVACQGGHLDAAKALIAAEDTTDGEESIDLEAADSAGRTALHIGESRSISPLNLPPMSFHRFDIKIQVYSSTSCECDKMSSFR